MTATATTVPGYKALLRDSYEGASRFLGAIKQSGMRFVTVHKDLQLWTVDGTTPATYTADGGTDGQQQHPTLTFAYASADDLAFIRDTVPLEFKPGGKVYLLVKWSSADHDPTHKANWDGTMRRIPCGNANISNVDYSGNVVQDAAGTAFTGTDGYCDDTVNEIVSTFIDLDGVDLFPLDTVQIQLVMDMSGDTLTADAVVHDTAILYER